MIRENFRQKLLSPLRLLLRSGVSSWLGSEELQFKPKAYIYALGMSDEGASLLKAFDFEQIREPYEVVDHLPSVRSGVSRLC